MHKNTKKAEKGKGTVQAGGDKHGYLGHYRASDTIKRGHNQGAPGMQPLQHPMFNPISNPQGFQQALGGISTGMPVGSIPQARAPRPKPVAPAPRTSAANPGINNGTTSLPAPAPRGGTAAPRSLPTTMVLEPGGGMQTPGGGQVPRMGPPMPPAQAVGAARQGLQQSIGNVRNARASLRGAVQGSRGANTTLQKGKQAKTQQRQNRMQPRGRGY